MSGHSKWSNIKHKKEASDAKRGKVFTIFAKQIASAVKEGGSGDPQNNNALRLVIDKARAVNMPKGNIQRAIDRGLGKTLEGVSLQEIVYEGYGPGSAGFMVVAVTDNPHRTGADIRHIFSRNGGSLGGPGSASFLFERQKTGDYAVKLPIVIVDQNQQQQLQTLIDLLRECDDVEDAYCAGEWEGKE